MPNIEMAMRRSIRRGVGDILVDSLLRKRTITSSVDSVKNTFSSWDNCMEKTYCKWPIIAAIVIAVLIVLSIVWCIVRFLSCCDCCGGACDGKKDKPHKHLDTDVPPANQGYQAPTPMMGDTLPPTTAPQFAQFEIGKNGFAVEKNKVNEDALPPMPSWDAASKKRISTEEEKDAVELGELDPATGQKMPLMAGTATGTAPPSMMSAPGYSPYGQPVQTTSGPYTGATGDSSYNPNNQPQVSTQNFGRGQQGGRGYGQDQNGGQDQYVIQDQYGNTTAHNTGYDRAQNGQPERQYSNSSSGQYPSGPQRQYSNASHSTQQQYQTPYDSQSAVGGYGQPSRGPGSRGPVPGRMNSPLQSTPHPRSNPNRTASPLVSNGFGFGAPEEYPQTQSPSRYQQQPQTGYVQQQRPQPQSLQSYSSYAQSSAPSYRTRADPEPVEMDAGYSIPQAQYRGPPANGGGRSGGGGYGRGGGGYGGGGQIRDPPQNWDPVQQ
ncbi:hypothetical protein BJ878DRAFT_477946 [Calycina marina]|uniref:Fibroin-3 related protein n=1 Tax=Calycina marina TaxID=1763456 RepID=A0A9P7Z7J9_9HELO|nr:hypothetical protein BJ878DRAFT_477946 [Calycina marina]